MTLATYKAVPNAGATRFGDTQGKAVRDISYDVRLIGLDPETIESVKSTKKLFDAKVTQVEKTEQKGK